MKKFGQKLKAIYALVLYVLHAIFFPILIRDWLVNYRVYMDVARHLKREIGKKGEFFNFLERYEFQEDALGLGRLYSVQDINTKIAEGLNDDELNIYIMDGLAEHHNFLIRQGFIEMLLMKTKRISRVQFTMILEIANFGILRSIAIHMLFSAVLWALICRITWVVYNPEITDMLNTSWDFVKSILGF